jgi:hypothetical protein
VHLRTSLVQLFALLQLNFEKVVQIIKLRRFGGAPNGYPFAALILNEIRSDAHGCVMLCYSSETFGSFLKVYLEYLQTIYKNNYTNRMCETNS